MNAQAVAQVAKFLKVSPNQIKRCEEWSKVLFVVVVGSRPRFVSKKVLKVQQEYTDIREYQEALSRLKFSQFAGEEIASVERSILPAASPFLPTIQIPKGNNCP